MQRHPQADQRKFCLAEKGASRELIATLTSGEHSRLY